MSSTTKFRLILALLAGVVIFAWYRGLFSHLGTAILSPGRASLTRVQPPQPPDVSVARGGAVSLDARNSSVRDTLVALSHASGTPISIDPAVSTDARVTASVHGWPAEAVMRLVARRAGLTVSVTHVAGQPDRLRIAPQIQLRAAGRSSAGYPASAVVIGQVSDTWRAKIDRDDSGIDKGWQAVKLDDSAWPTVSIARMWCTQDGPFKGLRGAYAWGRVKFRLDSKWRGRAIMMRFAGLDEQGQIFVNGKQIADSTTTPGGSVRPWDIEVTNAVRFDQPNVLAVRAYANSTLGGVYEPVTLYAMPKAP